MEQLRRLIETMNEPKFITPRRENGRLVGGTVRQGDTETQVEIEQPRTIQ